MGLEDLNSYLYRLFENDPIQMSKLTMNNVIEKVRSLSMDQTTDGQFKAVCLSGLTTLDSTGKNAEPAGSKIDSGYLKIIVKPLATFGEILPDPAGLKDLDDINEIIGMYQEVFTAVSDYVFTGADPIQFGQVVNCYFTEGSAKKSDFTGLRFMKPDVVEISTRYRLLATIPGFKTQLVSGFFSGEVYTLGTAAQNQTIYPPQPTTNIQALTDDWKPVGSMATTFGRPIPSQEAVNFARNYQVLLDPYLTNPYPSQETNDLWFEMVAKEVAPNAGEYHKKQIMRFFNSWAAKETSKSTNNPFATSYPAGSSTWKEDPHLTAYNWSKPEYDKSNGGNKPDGGRAWVKNYSTMEIGAKATIKTLRNLPKFYGKILDGLAKGDFYGSDGQANNAWWNSQEVQYGFLKWAGEGGEKYANDVKNGFNNHKKCKHFIPTRLPGGAAGRALSAKGRERALSGPVLSKTDGSIDTSS